MISDQMPYQKHFQDVDGKRIAEQAGTEEYTASAHALAQTAARERAAVCASACSFRLRAASTVTSGGKPGTGGGGGASARCIGAAALRRARSCARERSRALCACGPRSAAAPPGLRGSTRNGE